jgi:nucleoid-associated protein
MHIRAATMHQLKKVQFSHGEDVVDTVEREGLLPNDEVLSNVCVQTLNLFDKKGNNTGTFGDDIDLHRFPVRLNEYRANQHDFEAFSKLALAMLAEEMSDAAASNGGHYFFVHYEQSGNEHLLIAMLKLREGAGIDADLSLLPTLTIDTSKLHEAARINLTRWEAGMQPYLTFVKKRGEDKVTRYFRKALACTNYTSSQHHTSQVIEAAKEYVMSRPNASDEQRRAQWDAVRTSLHSAFASCKGEIVLDAIAVAVEPEEPSAFSDFVAEGVSAGKYSFDHAFKPHAETFKSLKRIKSHVGTVSLAFDLSDVKAGRVAYDQEAEVLIIQSDAVSHDLKQQVISSAIAGT